VISSCISDIVSSVLRGTLNPTIPYCIPAVSWSVQLVQCVEVQMNYTKLQSQQTLNHKVTLYYVYMYNKQFRSRYDCHAAEQFLIITITSYLKVLLPTLYNVTYHSSLQSMSQCKTAFCHKYFCMCSNFPLIMMKQEKYFTQNKTLFTETRNFTRSERLSLLDQNRQ